MAAALQFAFETPLSAAFPVASHFAGGNRAIRYTAWARTQNVSLNYGNFLPSSFIDHRVLKKSSHLKCHSKAKSFSCKAIANIRKSSVRNGSAVLERKPEVIEQIGGVGSNEEIDSVNLSYEYELRVATQAVQLACRLTQKVQERLRKAEEQADTKQDRSLVTVADWGVQAVISWVLSQAFPYEDVSIVGEEDTEGLKGRAGVDILQRVVTAVNECISESPLVGLPGLREPLNAMDVLKAINRGASQGGPRGRHWILDPVDGTLGFVRGDQYAVALALMDEGQVVLGVLGCPNLPKRSGWLRYPVRLHQFVAKLYPGDNDAWNVGAVLKARKGGGGVFMEPIVNENTTWVQAQQMAEQVFVSPVVNAADAVFCEPVEKGNSSHTLTADISDNLGMRSSPIRMYSMAKYATIARGDAEIFMKFAKAGYREKIWDHAAGVIIVEEAGGIVTDAGGKPLDFSQGRFLETLDRGIVASSNVSLHQQLMESVDLSFMSSRL